jgi:hypothetical protein
VVKHTKRQFFKNKSNGGVGNEKNVEMHPNLQDAF